MAVLSALRPLSRQLACLSKTKAQVPVRCGGGHTAVNRPLRWVGDKIKDDIHFYVLLAGIPVGLWVMYMNITEGQASSGIFTIQPVHCGN